MNWPENDDFLDFSDRVRIYLYIYKSCHILSQRPLQIIVLMDSDCLGIGTNERMYIEHIRPSHVVK